MVVNGRAFGNGVYFGKDGATSAVSNTTRMFPLPDSLLRDMHEVDPIDGGTLNSIPTQLWLLLN